MPRYIDADAMDVEKIYCYYSDHCRSEDVQEWVDEQPTLDLEPVRHGRWVLEAQKETVNCRWNVTAFCSECFHDKGEIWAGFFPGVPESIAREVSIMDADTVKLDNFCPNCGARMDLEREAEGRADKR